VFAFYPQQDAEEVPTVGNERVLLAEHAATEAQPLTHR
jgi:hypothetical protein